jgi:predicted ATP-grasp superfamily ATP-dependent carboligase
MRVFLYEYTCAGDWGICGPAAALQAEGWAMLSALLQDFGRVPNVEVVTLLDERFERGGHDSRYRRVRAGEEEAVFAELARTADATIVIAPEFDDILLTRCRWVEAVGGSLLGPSSAAVALTADKLALSRHWRDRGVPTPECQALMPGERPPKSFYPLVWKPRFGAGSQVTFLVSSPEEWSACALQGQTEGCWGDSLVQPFVPGLAASVALLIGPTKQVPLLPATQNLSLDGRFQYRGGTLPLRGRQAHRAVRLARQATETVPGLRGYVGVDLVLGEAADGNADQVIELNPRLTTSYVGLRAQSESNLAEAMLRLALEDEPPQFVWREGQVRFRADGQVDYLTN